MSQRKGETDVEYQKRRRENTKTVFKGLMDGLQNIIDGKFTKIHRKNKDN